jgi:hypothetical protein
MRRACSAASAGQSAERRPCGNTTRSVVHGYHWVSNWSNWDHQSLSQYYLRDACYKACYKLKSLTQGYLNRIKGHFMRSKMARGIPNYMTVTWRLHGLTGLIRGETTYVSPPTHQPTNNHQPLYKYHQTQRFVLN